MAYTAWSVVYGEQPTAAKWNQLGTNDAGFKDGTNIDNLAILNRHINADAVDLTKIDWADFALNIKSATNGSSVSPTNTTQNFAANGVAVTFTVASDCFALVSVSMGISSNSDYEFRPIIYRDGVAYKQILPPAAYSVSGRAHVRGFTWAVPLTAGAHTLSAGVFLAAGTSMAMPADSCMISALVLGDVTA